MSIGYCPLYSYGLVVRDLDHAVKPVSRPSVDHIMVVDCSGSMASDLPKLRMHIKNRLPRCLAPGHRLTLIWFSGKEEAGVIFEGQTVDGLRDLQAVQEMVDRWLKPVGMTGFVKPLRLVKEVINRVPASNRVSLFFMTDGHDNQWAKSQIFEALAGVQASSYTFVEYGYYANRDLIAEMSARTGGSHIFAEDYVKYEPALEKAISSTPEETVVVHIDDAHAAVGGVAFALVYGNIHCWDVSKVPVIDVPASVKQIGYVTRVQPPGDVRLLPSGQTAESSTLSMLCVAASVFAQRARTDVVKEVVRGLGSVWLGTQLSNCFGKQAWSAFQESALHAAKDQAALASQGWGWFNGTDPNALSVLEVLHILQQGECAINLRDLRYSKIGRGTTLKDEDAAEFTPSAGPATVLSLVQNEERPNIGLRVKAGGWVKLPEDLRNGINWPVHQYKTYNVIKDGLLNIKALPLKVDPNTWVELNAKKDLIATGVATEVNPIYGEFTLNLDKLPIINEKDVSSVAVVPFFNNVYRLAQLRASQAVYNTLGKQLEKTPDTWGKSESDVSAWLESQGVGADGLYQPARKLLPPRDCYLGKRLVASIKGMSDTPKLAAVLERLDEGNKVDNPWGWRVTDDTTGKRKKPTQVMKLMLPAISTVITVCEALRDQPEDVRKPAFQAWVKANQDYHTKAVRDALSLHARNVFSIILGQTWLSSSWEETEFPFLSVMGEQLIGKAQLSEVEVEI
jgi:hypothetical protein